MEEDPIPVVVCSTAVGKDPENTVRALQAGAVSVVARPSLGVGEFVEASAAEK